MNFNAIKSDSTSTSGQKDLKNQSEAEMRKNFNLLTNDVFIKLFEYFENEL